MKNGLEKIAVISKIVGFGDPGADFCSVCGASVQRTEVEEKKLQERAADAGLKAVRLVVLLSSVTKVELH